MIPPKTPNTKSMFIPTSTVRHSQNKKYPALPSKHSSSPVTPTGSPSRSRPGSVKHSYTRMSVRERYLQLPGTARESDSQLQQYDEVGEQEWEESQRLAKQELEKLAPLESTGWHGHKGATSRTVEDIECWCLHQGLDPRPGPRKRVLCWDFPNDLPAYNRPTNIYPAVIITPDSVVGSETIEMGSHTGIWVLTPLDLDAIPFGRVFHLFADPITSPTDANPPTYQYKGLFKAHNTTITLNEKAYGVLSPKIRQRAKDAMKPSAETTGPDANDAYRRWSRNPAKAELVLLEACSFPQPFAKFKESLLGGLVGATFRPTLPSGDVHHCRLERKRYESRRRLTLVPQLRSVLRWGCSRVLDYAKAGRRTLEFNNLRWGYDHRSAPKPKSESSRLNNLRIFSNRDRDEMLYPSCRNSVCADNRLISDEPSRCEWTARTPSWKILRQHG
ncbi:uncharacterized protein BXZ73DRAFT_80608 [Epithele typhae]|uniref:uncharacterized protein n=1 Tax=Epithele typhae TaxID=378194 RepID=UPI00200768B1|nr:uncharacterized protein BXZ73DRAFT_80608 [Epithele typhae]KAH9918374.1 hypothetical protein BXZ73DRAFT_80608 [Epithele typhae]